ncbi:MAG: arginase [Bacteroidia bacterium]
MDAERFRLIIVESDFGAGNKGAALGPQALLDELIQRNFKKIDLQNYLRISPLILAPSTETPYGKNIENITNYQLKVCENISATIRENKIPFIFSGDHSSANALISGVKDVYANNRIGVVWIDAHADLHSPYTTPSGNIHGMPIAALMGRDHIEMQKNQPKEITKRLWETLKRLGRRHITPKIQGEDLVFISLRSSEKEEERIIVKENIRVFNPSAIANVGIEEIAQLTKKHLKNCEYIYVSFDVDALDPGVSKGTGTPVEGGLTLDEATYLFRSFLSLENLAGIEITEINPNLDAEKPMQKVIADLLEKI